MVGATFDQVRRIALELPGAEEVSTWGSDTTFRVNGRMFATAAPEASYATVKASPEHQAALVADEPDTFAAAPYTGGFGWVRVELSRVEPGQIRDLVVSAWRHTAPRKLHAAYSPGA
jgi:hypothetical protein